MMYITHGKRSNHTRSKVSKSASGSYQFPRLATTSIQTPWRPHLAGEGDFPEVPMEDAIVNAQATLARLEEGTLKLAKLVDEDAAFWDRPRAA